MSRSTEIPIVGPGQKKPRRFRGLSQRDERLFEAGQITSDPDNLGRCQRVWDVRGLGDSTKLTRVVMTG